MFFLSAFGLEDGGKKGTKTSRNGSQYGRKSIPEESAKKKRGKYENEQLFYVLARFGCLRGWKIEEEIEKTVSKRLQNRRVISERIFKGFLSILKPFWEPRSTSNRRKRASKRRPTVCRSCMVVLLRSSLGHCGTLSADPPWSASQYAPDLS